MNRVLREPLVHFLVIGKALFAVHAALNRSQSPAPEDVTITRGQIETLAIGFTRVWHRPPTGAELKDLIDNQVKEEILSREAMRLGLDQNDTVIRHRLQQKMEFLAEDFAASREPSDAEVQDYLARHPEQFATEPLFSFRQVFFSRDGRGDQLESDAAALLVRLKEHPSTETGDLGDRLLLPRDFTNEPLAGVAAQFGPEFASALAGLRPGEWSGPIHSGSGGLVLLAQKVDGRLPPLNEVRDQVRELMDARRREANQRLLDGLLSKYRVTIQQPPPDPAPAVRMSGIGR